MDAVIFGGAGLLVGLLGFWSAQKVQSGKKKKHAQGEARKIVNKARAEASKLERQANDKLKSLEAKLRKKEEAETRKIKDQARQQEQKLKDKSKQLEKSYQEKLQELDQQKLQIKDKEERVKTKVIQAESLKNESQQKLQELTEKLESVAQFNKQQAIEELKTSIKQEAEAEAAKMIMAIEQEAKVTAEVKAKKILGVAVSRFAGEFSSSKTINTIPLKDQDLKGKIIGKEGRNIRTIEKLCGVDLILDENPEAVVVSGFDPVRREVASRALLQLIEDGRIHPGRIEEVIQKTKKDLFRTIKVDGEKACLELGLTGVHPEIQKLIGSLKYRTSFTQNQYSHSIEVGLFSGIMAAEMGVNVQDARRAGLMHDMGKAMDHSIEGSHAMLGADFAKRYGEKAHVVYAIRAHHEEVTPKSILDFIVIAADTLSGARPGARKSTAENYVQRLEDLESIANSFEGVERTFAIQAGREIRVIVDSSRVTDEQSVMLSRDIARKIEREMKYPGQIKISVVRETRAVQHAR